MQIYTVFYCKMCEAIFVTHKREGLDVTTFEMEMHFELLCFMFITTTSTVLEHAH